jgi:DNA-directed RNA polymerase specialized sigma24 family protein
MIVDENTLAQLMRRAQRGDADAYTVALKACAHWLQHYFHRRLPPHQIDDVVQDTIAVTAQQAVDL